MLWKLTHHYIQQLSRSQRLASMLPLCLAGPQNRFGPCRGSIPNADPFTGEGGEYTLSCSMAAQQIANESPIHRLSHRVRREDKIPFKTGQGRFFNVATRKN
jgi:hypothetical protein